ncbi:MAG TPA: hypothetical protein PK200_17730, partial [Spirochaetota bacterium]|nr:hypothetical protein [Spirochaetota bacterium]
HNDHYQEQEARLYDYIYSYIIAKYQIEVNDAVMVRRIEYAKAPCPGLDDVNNYSNLLAGGFSC